MEEGWYDLCIDEGTQVIQLTSEFDGWSRMEAGTTIVMRVVIEQQTTPFEGRYQCHCCGTWNDFDLGSISHSLEHQTDISIDW